MRLLVFAIVISLSSAARAGLRGELYIGVPSGAFSLEETGSPDATHASKSDGGFHGGLKFGLLTNLIQFGVLGEYGSRASNVERTPDSGSSSRYALGLNRTLGGAYLGLPIMQNFFRFHFEYYPVVKASISSAEDVGGNPFHKGDTLDGNGYAAGFGLLWPRANVTILYRSFNYSKADLNGTATDLPSSQYGPVKTTEITLSVGLMY